MHRTCMQSLVLIRIALSECRTRLGASLVIVVGIAFVVGVLAYTLAMRAGLLRMFAPVDDPTWAIVLSAKSPTEFGSAISPGDLAVIQNAPGIAISRHGRPMADGEVKRQVNPQYGLFRGYINVVGVGNIGIELRPQLHILEGRMFKAGVRELLIGRNAQPEFGLKVGDKVPLPGDDWTIVGSFSSGGDALESQFLADATTFMTSAHILGFGSVLVRLRDPASFGVFKQWLIKNPTLDVAPETQAEFVASVGGYMAYLKALAYFVGAVMSIGAVFGSINILYAEVSARGVEIGTLRAMGYQPVAIASSIVAEVIILALAGAIIGLSIVWLLFSGQEMISDLGISKLTISTEIVALGLFWAIMLALLGSIPPAIRAARAPITDALRAT